MKDEETRNDEGTTNDEEKRSAREDLAMISRLMEQGRGTMDAGAPHFVVWGVLVTAALVGSYLNAVGAIAVDELWLWVGTVGAGWISSLVIGARSSRRRAVRGPGGRIVASIWIGAGIALTVLGFVAAPVQAFTEAGALLGAMATVLGAACFASAAVQGTNGFRLLAAGWWGGSVAMFVWPGLVSLLVMAGLMVCLHLVPGVWLALRAGGRPAATGGAV